jgi:hypothetical protein|tara:strand:+ start:64 stop:918 length:855 start_codon:yes stop_codon:yes gene_type:complete
MEIIWVIENVKRSEDFYKKQFTLLLAASVCLWKRYHPDHKTVLYADDLTSNYYKETPLLDLFDEVRPLSYSDKINRKVFWSSSKTKIISKTKVPIIVVDHDFLIFQNIDKYLKDKVLYSYDELADNWYPPTNCSYSKKLTTPINRTVNKAANVSLFYLPDPKFARKYGKQVLKNHKEFTKMEVKDTNYMILSEQLMLKQWLVNDNIPHNTLSKNIFDCKDVGFTLKENLIGIWNIKESSLYYKHYGVEEKTIDHTEMMYLFRCINSTQKNKWDIYQDWILKQKD